MKAIAARVDGGIGEQPVDAGDDARRDSLASGVRRRHFDARERVARCRIDRDDVGKRSADVDADADAVWPRLTSPPRARA